ncbi:MAG TPA: hypothetical protein VMV29_08370 [Ktedonobacterales bacterium]|nr:hypothetical protein [Ktedonobacterales bacterium]HUY76774.1 hypothetical protein [Ktedonobacterales bacterium]
MAALNKKPSGYLIEDSPTEYAANKISKAAWIDLYIDLYRQTHGEGATDAQVIEDAQRRLQTLKAAGIR